MSLVRIALAIALVGYWGMGLKGVYWSLLITSLGFGVVLTIRELRRGSLRIDWKKCLAIVNFGLPFVPTGLLFFFLLNADRFFLLRSLGASEVGLYALGAKLAERWVVGKRIRDVAAAPDGTLWLLEDNANAALIHVTPK